MASFEDLEQDWSSLCQDSEFWTTQDLQLAAELGKTLLERNKELETSLKQHQNVIEDQTQEIEYLTKQTVALREVNDSRLRIYEQLEVSIQDLERANHRLAVENTNDKKHIKSLTATIESLETKCEELQCNIDELKIELDVCKKKAHNNNGNNNQRSSSDNGQARKAKTNDGGRGGGDEVDSGSHREQNRCDVTTKPSEKSQQTQTTPNKQNTSDQADDVAAFDSNVEQIAQLMSQLRERNSQCTRDCRRIAELEEQLATMIQQNQELEGHIVNLQCKDADMKSMHEELNTLEEVRQGQLCSKCLRTVDSRDDMSLSLCDDREDDDSSMMEALTSTSQHRSSFSMEVQAYGKTSTPPSSKPEGGNPYRELVEKYEALVKVQKTTHRATHKPAGNAMSLQEELALSGDFNNTSTKDTDEESGHFGDTLRPPKKSFSRTPTDFSEAETSSSGFSDETSNKSTQTDRRPGSFLCTIGDGEDCFSIYDDATNIEGRFRNRPEYRELFSEIFGVLKKAAKNNEELPLVDDRDASKPPPKVPPVTPCAEQLPDFPDNVTDDTRSVLSSAVSEASTGHAEPTTVIENVVLKQEATKPEAERVLTPLVRQPLEYLSVGVNVRKRSSSRRKKQQQLAERSDSPITHIVGSPTIRYASRPGSGRRRRNNENENWNGSTLQFWSSRNAAPSPTPSQGSGKTGLLEFKPSAASQDLHKLKKLDLSYAEVLRNADSKKRECARYKPRK